MAHVFIPDGVRVVIQAEETTDHTELLHVIHVRVPTPPPDYAACLSIAQIVATWWQNQYRSICNNKVTLRQVVATGMNAVPAAQATVTSSVAGFLGGVPLTPSIALCLKLATNLTGRRQRGRVYLWPADVGVLQDEQSFVAPYVAAAIGTWTTLGSALAAGGYIWSIASLVDVALHPITRVVAVDTIIDSQRRRLAGRGR